MALGSCYLQGASEMAASLAVLSAADKVGARDGSDLVADVTSEGPEQRTCCSCEQHVQVVETSLLSKDKWQKPVFGERTRFFQ